MRPLRLRMVAFGPFAGEEVIDFEQLGPAALFLIEGATGAGKTTVLDAICYALYDKSTGGERDARQMRSDFASPDRLTEVELEFLLGAVRYRIRRVPEQIRPRQRGEGSTRQAALAELYRTENGAETVLVARKVGDANAEIVRLTGLTVEQFRQVMVLPQGQFRKLLTSESKERQAILQNLFGTELYSRISESLRVRTSELSARYKEIGLRRDAEFRALGLDLEESMDRVLASARGELESAQAEQLSANKSLQACSKALSDAEALAERFRERTRAQAVLAELDQQKATHHAREVLLKSLHAAETLAPIWLAWSDLGKERAQAVAAAAQAAKNVELAQAGEAAAQTLLDAAERRLEARASTLSALQATEAKLPLITDLEQALAAHRQTVANRVSSDKALEALATRLRASQQTANELAQQASEARLAAAALPGLEQQLAQHRRRERIDAERARLQSVLAQHDDTQRRQSAQVAEAERVHASAQTLRRQAEALWQSRQAMVLASSLRRASPCPVCGSTDHPSPAGAQGELLADDPIDLIGARASEEAARASLDAVRSQAQSSATAVSGVKAQLDALGDAAREAAPALDELMTELTAARAGAAAADGLARSSDTAQRALTEQTRLHDDALLARQVSLQAESAAEARRDQCQAQLGDEGVPERGVLDARVAALRAEVEEMDANHRAGRLALETARLQRVRATAEREAAELNAARLDRLRGERESCWLAALSDSVFAEEADFLTAQARRGERESLSAEHTAYSDARRAADAAIAVVERALSGKTRPDLAQLGARRDLRQAAVEVAETQRANAQARVNQLQEAQQRLAALHADRSKVESAYRVAASLSMAANGQNRLKLNLQSFVLSVLLDDVLVAAGERLRRMTRGRYQLVRREGVTHGGRQAGLDLDVDDAHTGRRRQADTLSGGESFMAALALALGLSDVVQAHAGGIRLDTLFIDEGFGSLDPESLDLAVRALVDLQSSGRLVGVISHVPELAEQIQSRLQVRSGPTGSRAKLIINPGVGAVTTPQE